MASFFETQGVLYACISPGARNSPLTYTFTNHTNITCYSHIDERSSSFFGLGLAKSSNKPVIILSTSGTATANFLPAVIEASLGRVPIIILSADRPEYLISTGANQTINQQKLFGNHVRYFKDIGLPSKNIDSLGNILEEAMSFAIGADYKLPPGPVHLNVPFDEPLFINSVEKNKTKNFLISRLKWNKPAENKISILEKANKPLIVVGPMESNQHQNDIISFSDKIQAPILADPLSQIRYGYSSTQITAHYDHFLQTINILPDLIIRFGKKPTSKKLCKLLDDNKKHTYLVDSWMQYNDDCINFIQSPIDRFCRKQISGIMWEGKLEWKNLFLSYEERIKQLIQSEEEYSEASIVRVCHELLEKGDQFIIGNSMPIRDVDMFTPVSTTQIDTYANRGVSGIDGVISTALGISINNNRKSLLIIGDLSFYHDMNGLLASKYGMDITIVIINNNGGGIFSFLPIAEVGIKGFDKYWTTNTGLDFHKVAELYQCGYSKATNLDEVKLYVQKNLKKKGVQIVEVQICIDENVQAHKKFSEKVQSLL